MTEAALATSKELATWGGVVVTLAGVVYNISTGADIVGACISLSGIGISCGGHFIGRALARHQKAARDAAEARIEELESIAYDASQMLNDPDFKRLVERERWDYYIEHQDDGR